MLKSFPFITTLLLAPLAALLCFKPSVSAVDRKPVLIESKRIWDKAQYNSFTDLTRFRDKWFCCFREGIARTADIGKVRVLRSPDGVVWTSVALIEEDGMDLRDPKFSIEPDGQLMIIAGGLTYDMAIKPATVKTKQPCVMFSTDGLTWTTPAKILEEGQWLWRGDGILAIQPLGQQDFSELLIASPSVDEAIRHATGAGAAHVSNQSLQVGLDPFRRRLADHRRSCGGELIVLQTSNDFHPSP